MRYPEKSTLKAKRLQVHGINQNHLFETVGSLLRVELDFKGQNLRQKSIIRLRSTLRSPLKSEISRSSFLLVY